VGDLAKIFWTGRSQAVRLPKEYRFEGSQVRIWREGARVFLAPVESAANPDAVGQAAADALDALRARIQEGIDSGEPVPLDMAAIKAAARKRFPPAD